MSAPTCPDWNGTVPSAPQILDRAFLRTTTRLQKPDGHEHVGAATIAVPSPCGRGCQSRLLSNFFLDAAGYLTTFGAHGAKTQSPGPWPICLKGWSFSTKAGTDTFLAPILSRKLQPAATPLQGLRAREQITSSWQRRW